MGTANDRGKKMTAKKMLTKTVELAKDGLDATTVCCYEECRHIP